MNIVTDALRDYIPELSDGPKSNKKYPPINSHPVYGNTTIYLPDQI